MLILYLVFAAKCTFSFLRPRLNNQPPAFLFTTQAFPLQQKVVDSVVQDASLAEGGKSTPGNKTKSKTKQSKKKKGRKNTGEAVKDTNSNEVDNTVIKPRDSAGSRKKKEKNSKSAAKNKNKKGKNTAKTVESIKDANANKDQDNIVRNFEKKQSSTLKYDAADSKIQTERLNTDTKGKNTLKDHSRQQDLFSKAAGTSLVIESLDNDEVHQLHFSPDAVLIEAEEDLQGGSKFEDAHVIDSADVEVGTIEDPTLQSKTAPRSESEPEQHFKDRSFKDGTPGGRWFKEETLAEIDAYLYLGKVGFKLSLLVVSLTILGSNWFSQASLLEKLSSGKSDQAGISSSRLVNRPYLYSVFSVSDWNYM